MSLSKICIKPTMYLIYFKRLIRDAIGVFLIRNWKQTEKESVMPIEDVMLPEVFRIQEEGFENQGQNELIKYSKKLRKIFYVIKSQDQVVGYSTYYIRLIPSLKGFKKISVICSISVDKSFRRKGFGEKLLKESIQEMKLNKVSSILLYVSVNNTSAVKLYEKLGFRIIKETKNICGDKRCYEMELNLI